MIHYAQDYDEKMVTLGYHYASNIPANEGRNWTTLTQPYLKSTQIFVCPSDTTTGKTNGYYSGTTSDTNFHTSYLYNRDIGSVGPSDFGQSGVALASFNSTASTVMVADGDADPTSNPITPTQWTPKDSGKFIMSPVSQFDGDFGAPIPRHLETCNVLYADGHVKSQRIEKFFTYASPTLSTKMPCLDITKGCQ